MSSREEGYHYPAVLPLCLAEEDPNASIGARVGNLKPTPTRDVLVIPMYCDAHVADGVDRFAISHPFVYRQGDEIERRLESFGNRANLSELVLWVPGYFPNSVGRIFRLSASVDGKEMIALQLQRCVGSEEGEINAAMLNMLNEREFRIEAMEKYRTRPPYSKTAMLHNEPYNIVRLVHCEGYESRFWQFGCPTTLYILWGSGGRLVVNRMSADDQRIVADFAKKLGVTKSPTGK